MIKAKIYHTRRGKLLAACDSEIFGSNLVAGDLEIKVGAFYDGKEVGDKVLVEMLKASKIVNLIGNRVVKVAVDAGVVKKDNILRIGNVQHAQVVVVR